MASIIRAKGVIEAIAPKNGKKFTLKEAQSAVGGWVEVIQLANDCILIVNEEGKLQGLPYNEEATELFRKNFPSAVNDYIVGDAILCKSNEF